LVWKIKIEEGFSRYLKHKGSQEIKRFDNAVLDLGDSQDPIKLGEEKQTKRHGICYVMDVGKNRLAYRVYQDKHVVELACFGDHKTVYGKD